MDSYFSPSLVALPSLWEHKDWQGLRRWQHKFFLGNKFAKIPTILKFLLYLGLYQVYKGILRPEP